MKNTLRKAMLALFILTFLVSTAMLLKQHRDNIGGSNAYEHALVLASGSKQNPSHPKVPAAPVPTQILETETWIPEPVTDDPNWDFLREIHLEALQEVNPDVVGWIWIPESKINYPFLQGSDNDFYLNHTWEKQENSVGSIFLEQQCNPALTDYNTILYGHNMKNGSMFAELGKYATQTYWDSHPYVYLLTEAGIFRYEIFSAYKADVDSITYGLSFHQEQTKANFLIHALDNSQIQTGIIPEPNDRILTLSTCSGAGYTNRWVVQARLKMIRAEEPTA